MSGTAWTQLIVDTHLPTLKAAKTYRDSTPSSSGAAPSSVASREVFEASNFAPTIEIRKRPHQTSPYGGTQVYEEANRAITGWTGTDCSMPMCAQGFFDPFCTDLPQAPGGEVRKWMTALHTLNSTRPYYPISEVEVGCGRCRGIADIHRSSPVGCVDRPRIIRIICHRFNADTSLIRSASS